MINKAKMEYYENEMAKKEQEILDLLDVKKVRFIAIYIFFFDKTIFKINYFKTEVISIAESKSDVSAVSANR
jgi:aminopeptidase C